MNFQCSAFFPNITESNNKFYYTAAGQVHELTIETGSYEVKDLDKYIKEAIGVTPPPISFEMNESTGKVKFKLLENYSVDFTRPNTFRELLGFDALVLNQRVSQSQHVDNIMKNKKVYISCNLCQGSVFKGRSSNILYSFSNSYRYGSPIYISPFQIQNKLLIENNFSEIRISFFDENLKPIDFNGADFSLTIMVKQI